MKGFLSLDCVLDTFITLHLNQYSDVVREDERLTSTALCGLAAEAAAARLISAAAFLKIH